MVRQGFSQVADSPQEPNEEMLDAIALEDIRYDVVKIGDYQEGELPTLPIGVFLEASGDGEGEERLTTFTVNPEVGKGKYSLLLGKLEEQGGQNAKNTVKTISSFLEKAIDTIGGYPLIDVARRFGNSPLKLFENMYLADIVTLMFGVRMQARGRDIAVNMKCPVCREPCRDNPEKGRPLHDLDGIEIKMMPELSTKPLIRVTLPTGISDAGDTIKNLYFEPLKFYQLGMFIGGGKVTDVQMLIAMIAAIPESSVYGKKKGRPFCEELYAEMEEEDIAAVMAALQKIQPGPETTMSILCACGQEEIDYQIQWARAARDFIYFSSKPIADDK